MSEQYFSIFSNINNGVVVAASLIFGIALIYIIHFYVSKLLHENNNNNNKMTTGENQKSEESDSRADEKVVTGQSGKQKQSSSKKGKHHHTDHNKKSKQVYSHPWLLTSLKGHTGQILDFDITGNGKYLVSCADDRSVLLWTIANFTDKEHRSVRTNVQYDYVKLIKWSPDDKAFITCKAQEDEIQVFKIGKKKGGIPDIQPSNCFPKRHAKEIMTLDMACTGKFMMTCSIDSTVYLWNLKGEVLASFVTNQVKVNAAAVSPCGRYVATAGFTPDVKVWQVMLSNETGQFKEVKNVFNLKGHSSGVLDFSFNSDSSRTATISKDGTWKLWKTDVDVSRGQEPSILNSVKIAVKEPKAVIALSPDSRVVVISIGDKIHIYGAVSGREELIIESAFYDGVQKIMFDPLSKYFVCSGDRSILVFNNVAGYKVIISELEGKCKEAQSTKSLKARLEQQIQEARDSLETILSSTKEEKK